MPSEWSVLVWQSNGPAPQRLADPPQKAGLIATDENGRAGQPKQWRDGFSSREFAIKPLGPLRRDGNSVTRGHPVEHKHRVVIAQNRAPALAIRARLGLCQFGGDCNQVANRTLPARKRHASAKTLGFRSERSRYIRTAREVHPEQSRFRYRRRESAYLGVGSNHRN